MILPRKACLFLALPCLGLLPVAAHAAPAAPSTAAPAEGMSALKAMNLLPKEAIPRLARIEGFEGNPVPERWHLLVHDSAEENGVHEYVVAAGEIVASRAVSQFAEELKEDDIIGGEAIKIDSAQAAKIAQQYASANRLKLATLNFELKKDGEDAVPLWRVSCLDTKGEEIGQILLTATKGAVLRHEGFTLEPPGKTEKPAEKSGENDKPEKSEKTEKTSSTEKKETSEKPKAASERQTSEKPPSGEPAKRAEARKPAPAPAPEPKPVATPLPRTADDEHRPGFFQRAGGTMQKIFTGNRNAPPAEPAPAPAAR